LRVLAAGGSGVFGARLCRELAQRGQVVTVAARRRQGAEAVAAALGEPHRALALDLDDGRALRAALEAHDALACCAGPFAGARTAAVLAACLEVGRHYADIAEERESLAAARAASTRFAERGLLAVVGCSSLPGVSAALALRARAAGPAEAPRRARVTLFIGNDNAKGEAAAASLLRQMGRPIAAPQGTLRGLRECVRVSLPAPIGPRLASTFDGPELDLFPPLLGVAEVETKVAFELPGAIRLLALLAALGLRPGGRAARWMVAGGNLTRRFGHSSGAVMVELSWKGGATQRAALTADRDGQRVAVLPCALALAALDGGAPARGTLLPHELLGADGLLDALVAEGFTLHAA